MTATNSMTSLNKSPRPKSTMANMADDVSMRCSSRQLVSEEEVLHPGRDQQPREQWKRSKSQTFSQISQVALAAAIMQRAANESRERRRMLAEDESPEYNRIFQEIIDLRDKENPFESLV
ncbi:hypothetical protein SK128_019213, partial [Halocaridina rubra]